jgi:hypothetical protein
MSAEQAFEAIINETKLRYLDCTISRWDEQDFTQVSPPNPVLARHFPQFSISTPNEIGVCQVIIDPKNMILKVLLTPFDKGQELDLNDPNSIEEYHSILQTNRWMRNAFEIHDKNTPSRSTQAREDQSASSA